MLEWIISSAVLTAVVIVLRLLLKGKMSLRLQYALWAVVLVRLLVPFSFGSTAVSVQNVVDRPAAERSTAREFSHISEALNDSVDYPLYMPQEVMETFYDAHVSDNVEYIEVGEAQNAAQTASESKAAEARSLTVNEILNIVWACGAGAIALWLLITNLHFYGRLRRSRERIEVEGAPLPVFVTDKIDTPCLFGLIRPKIYVTPEVAQDAAVLRYSIEHEATHRRHGDHIWAILRGLCLAVHWYNPLVWVAAILSRKDAELACDEATIKRIGEEHRADYGYTLLQLTCEKRPAIFVAATTMTGSGRSIKERIKLIVKKPKTAIITLIAIVLIVAIAVGCTFTGAKTDDVTTDATEDTEAPADLGVPDASDPAAVFEAIDLNEATLTLLDAENTAYPAGGAVGAEQYLDDLAQSVWKECDISSIDTSDLEDSAIIRLDAPQTAVTFYSKGAHHSYLVHVETNDSESWFMPPILEADAGWTRKVTLRRMLFWFDGAQAAALYGEDGRLMTADELAYFREYSASLSSMFTSLYNDVRDIKAWDFLLYFPGEPFEPMNEAEQQIATRIKDWLGFERDYSTWEGSAVYRIPRPAVDAFLQQYAGVTVEDMHTNWFEKVTYLPETDCFYILHSTYEASNRFNPCGGVVNGDVVTLWERGMVLDLRRVYNPFYILKLEKNGDGWRVLSYNTDGIPIKMTDVVESWTAQSELPDELAAAYQSLFASGDASLTLCPTNGGARKTLPLKGPYNSSMIWYDLQEFAWKQLDAPATMLGDYSLSVTSADRTKEMTFWDDGGAGIVQYTDGASSSFWVASAADGSEKSVCRSARIEFDVMEEDSFLYAESGFRFDGTPEKAFEYFATTVYVEINDRLSPGSTRYKEDLKIVGWHVTGVGEVDGYTKVEGSLTYAHTPSENYAELGHESEGSGENEGMLVSGLIFVLELQEDGNWHFVYGII